MNFSAFVAAYNKPIRDIPLMLALDKCDNLFIYVCDNSTDANIKLENKRCADEFDRVIYVDMGGNAGISRAFNAALRMSSGDIVCYFDDDTVVPDNYFDEAAAAVHSNPAALYLPLVYSGERLLSPLVVEGLCIHAVNEPSRLRGKELTGFNTGMFLSRELALEFEHDESLFLDFVDHAYCEQIRGAGIAIRIAQKIVLQQDYSRETNSISAALFRSKITERDVRQFYCRTLAGRIYAAMYIAYLRMRNTLKYRTLEFIKA